MTKARASPKGRATMRIDAIKLNGRHRQVLGDIA
jgi:hypothetical protein